MLFFFINVLNANIISNIYIWKYLWKTRYPDLGIEGTTANSTTSNIWRMSGVVDPDPVGYWCFGSILIRFRI